MIITIAEPTEWPADLAYALENNEGHEEVAILLGVRTTELTTIHAAYGVANVSPEPRIRWAIAGPAYREARDYGRTRGWIVLGHIHTHPGGGPPSAEDYRSLCTRHAYHAGYIGAVWDIPGERIIWYGRAELQSDPMPIPPGYRLSGPNPTVPTA